MTKVIFDVIKEFLVENPIYIVTTILFMGLIPINDIYMSKLYGTMFESIQQNTFKMDDMVKILVVTALLQIGYALMDLNDSKMIPLFQHKCKEIFLKNVFHDQKENYKELLTGDLLSKILRSQHVVTSWYSKLTTFIIPHIIEFAITSIYFYSIDKHLCLYFVTLILVFVVVLFVSPVSTNASSQESDKALSNIHEEIDDILTNYLSVHKEDKLNDELNRLQNKNNYFIKVYNSTVRISLYYRLFLTFSMLAFLFAFTYRSYGLLINKRMNKGLFFALIMMITHLVGNFIWMIDTTRDIIFDYGTIKNSKFLHKQNSESQEVKDYCDSLEKDKPIPILKMSNVIYKYSSQKNWALKDINFEINQGETILIVGEIGSGKTTLIKLLLRLLKPTTGNIYLNGKCYRDFTVKSFYKKVGFMPQNCILFNRSIIDNIKYDNNDVSTKRITETLHKFGIMKHFENLEDGVHSMAGKNGMNLSGGQRQLVWFIKLYLKDPDIIIMDEPTASIDHETKDLFKTIINEYMKEKTIIIVTHDNELKDVAERIIKVKNKSLVESI